MNLIDDWERAMPKKARAASSSTAAAETFAAMAHLQDLLAALPNSRDELQKIAAEAKEEARKIASLLDEVRRQIDRDFSERLRAASAAATGTAADAAKRAADALEASTAQRAVLDEVAETAAEISRRLLAVEDALDNQPALPEPPDVNGIVRGQVEPVVEECRREIKELEDRIEKATKALAESVDTRLKRIPTMVSAPPAYAKVYQDGTLVGDIRELNFVGATVTKNKHTATVEVEGGGGPGGDVEIGDVDGLQAALDAKIAADLSTLTASTSPDTDDEVIVWLDGALRRVPLSDVLALGGGGTAIAVRKSASSTINNDDTLDDDPHLEFPIAANQTILGEVVLWVTAPSATADFKVGFTGPAGGSIIFSTFSNRSADTLMETYAAVTAYATGLTIQKATGTHALKVPFQIENAGTAGTVHVQIAQGTATPSNTVVEEGSHILGRVAS